MKYLKKYDAVEYNSLYDVDDYIYVDPNWFTNKTPKLGKIIENDGSHVPYRVLFQTGEDGWIKPDMILRKMSEDEIEQYELKINSDKYNL